MKIEVFDDADAVARAAAAAIATQARMAVAARSRFTFAGGGHTPWIMLRALAGLDIPWDRVHIFQVDERVAPDGDPDRNLAHLRESLLQRVPLSREQIHAMPVESHDLETAAKQYGNALESAGINRQKAENENFSRERSSEPLGPELLRGRSRGLS